MKKIYDIKFDCINTEYEKHKNQNNMNNCSGYLIKDEVDNIFYGFVKNINSPFNDSSFIIGNTDKDKLNIIKLSNKAINFPILFNTKVDTVKDDEILSNGKFSIVFGDEILLFGNCNISQKVNNNLNVDDVEKQIDRYLSIVGHNSVNYYTDYLNSLNNEYTKTKKLK